MSRQIEGLWLGGAISVEAAYVVHELIDECLQEGRFSAKIRAELTDLTNAIHAQIQKAPAEPKPDPARYL